MQPLVLVFEDVHWAEEPLLDVIEHLARALRDAPVLIVCVARPDLLELRPSWGGGNPRAAALELAPLTPEESEELVDGLARRPAAGAARARAREGRGQPALPRGDAADARRREGMGNDIPDTVQALIAARIDALPPAAEAAAAARVRDRPRVLARRARRARVQSSTSPRCSTRCSSASSSSSRSARRSPASARSASSTS